MANLFEVKHEDIEALKPDQCVDLLRRLLICEAQKHQLAIKELHVPLNIFVPDDGEDGRIEFYTDPPQESQLSNRLTVFQCKAEYLTPAKCAKEICIKGSTVLKPLVEECLDAGSDYMFFTSHGLTKKQIKKCIKAVRSSIQNAGKEYSKTANIQIIDANRVRDWSNQFVAAVTAVQSWRGTPQVPGLFTWQGWSQDPEFSGFEFVADDTRTKHIQELRSHLSSARQSARIVGLSGLGKTRLALETFRPEENGADHSKNLNWKVAYLNARDQPQGLPGTVSSWVGTGLEGILIVDDCPLELHESLQKKIEHKSSCLSLLTLDFNPDQVSRFDRIIHLEPVSDELIKGMLKSVYTDRPDYELGQIAALADGFPQMAVLLAKARLVQGLHLDQVVDPALLQKLIGNVETQAEEVLKICALFEQLGFSGGREGEYQYVANTICQDINPDVFYRRVKEFVNRGIINQAGGYVRVEPRPLAVRLAAKWWEGCSPQKAREIMEKMPNPMVEALCDRMAMLDRLPQARAMVGEWCGDQGPFGQAEALNSERGSRLFRSLSEVNPAAALSALERAFGNWSREALMEIGAGRRNLIWTLEKLCFDGELFPRAARLMLAFAAAENETWDNNATGQFKQLFQLQQESTEAPPKDRTEIIDEALNSDDDHRRTIAVSALAMALNTHGSFRALGAERIGGGPPRKGWRARIWKEIFDYWRFALTRLTQVALGNDSLAATARGEVAVAIRGMVQNNRLEDMEQAIMAIVDHHGPLWPEAMGKIRDAIRFEGPQMPSDGKQQLEKWLAWLEPTEVKERLRLIVGTPSWEHEKNKDGVYVDLASGRAEKLAEELADKFDTWREHVYVLFQGEQRQFFPFGRRLGIVFSEPKDFIDAALEALAAQEKGNPGVLAAFLAEVRPRSPDLYDRTLDTAADTPQLRPYLADLTRLSKPTLQDLERILHQVDLGAFSVSEFRIFSFGGVLNHLPPEDMVFLTDRLLDASPDGAWIALDILLMYRHGVTGKWDIHRSQFRKIIMHPNLDLSKSANNMDLEHWKSVAEKLLDETDPDLVRYLTEFITNACKIDQSVLNYNHAFVPVLERAILNDREAAWPILSSALLVDDPLYVYRLQTIVGNRFDNGGAPGVLFSLADDFLFSWCEQHPIKAPPIIAKIMPLIRQVDEQWTWYPLARSIIDRFGNQKRVLSEISANLGTYSRVGSHVPYLQRQVQPFEELRNHSLLKVRLWAERHSRYLKEQIQSEKDRDAEHDWGIY